MGHAATLKDFIDRAARRFPEREAISCAGGEFTFAQLKERTGRLCASLYDLGLKAGDRVAVLMQNCHQHLELLHGVPAGGLTIVPLNWRLAPPELQYVLDDCQARALFVSKEFAPKVEGIRKGLATLQHVVLVDDTKPGYLRYEELIDSAPGLPSVKIGEHDMAYILYTSGTTGFPKGAVLTHRNVIESGVGMVLSIYQGMGADESVLILTPLYHVAGTVMAMTALVSGASTVLMKKAEIPEIFETIQRKKVTRTAVVPFIVYHMLEYPEGHRYDLSSLRTVVYAAAPMPVPLLKRAIERFGYVFAQGYGLTETGPSGTALTIAEHQTALETGKEQILSSAGREMLLCDVRVVDGQGKELPPGEVGEVIIRSPGVMKEYWNNPEATRESLKDGWLYTGDMGRFDEEGYLYLVDRKRDMVITGGENVYPKEVENVLFQHPAVADSAVIGTPDPEWGEKVVAVIVVRPGHSLTAQELIGYCRQRLAGYKCPKLVHFVDELPRNPSGKVLKTELRQQFGGVTTGPR